MRNIDRDGENEAGTERESETEGDIEKNMLHDRDSSPTKPNLNQAHQENDGTRAYSLINDLLLAIIIMSM